MTLKRDSFAFIIILIHYLLFEKDNLDFLHRNNEGKDALEIIKDLPQDESENARKIKEDYHKKILEYLVPAEKCIVKLDDF